MAARIKQDLLEGFNLHTVVRLPDGVFSPYTPIPTNVLFFDRSGPTKDIWFYEHPLPEERRGYTKTKPLQYEEFDPLFRWWESRKETERAWKVPVSRVRDDGWNLDLRNPNRVADLSQRAPKELLGELIATEQTIIDLFEAIEKALD